MKRLLLLRHAKSSHDDPGLDDRDRPLAERGRTDAPCVGAYMRRKKYLPDLVYCSTARRTVDTWELVQPELGSIARVEYLPALYLASASAMIGIIRGADNAAGTLLVIGHNPGLEECAAELAGQPETPAECETQDIMDEKFPTAALAVLDFDIARWKDAASDGGRLVNFVRPADLDG